MNVLSLLSKFAQLFHADCRPKGTLALAVRNSDADTHAECYTPDISPEQIKDLWPLIEDAFKETSDQDLSVKRIGFQGRQRELHCFRREDGDILLVLMDCASADNRVAELHALAAQFERCAHDTETAYQH